MRSITIANYDWLYPIINIAIYKLFEWLYQLYPIITNHYIIH